MLYGNGTIKGAAGPAKALSTLCAQCLEQSDRQVRMIMEIVQAAGDPQRLHQRWQGALAQCFDSFMRSPAFLGMMKRNLKVMSELKGLQDQIVHGTARQVGLPLANDITGLFERLNSTERTILNRLRAIEDRLKAVEAGSGTHLTKTLPHDSI